MGPRVLAEPAGIVVKGTGFFVHGDPKITPIEKIASVPNLNEGVKIHRADFGLQHDLNYLKTGAVDSGFS